MDPFFSVNSRKHWVIGFWKSVVKRELLCGKEEERKEIND